ncbi:MAG: VWA domain-containing protein [Vicinamibacteraceae bacterium]
MRHTLVLARLLARATCVWAVVALFAPSPAAQEVPHAPVFRAFVDLVPVTAVVRDERGRPIRDLRREEFVVLEGGRPRPIVDFDVRDQGPVSLALLMDTSGSMRVGRLREASREAVEYLLSWVQPAADEVGLFSFDRDLRQEVGFTKDLALIRNGVASLEGMGQTSLYDAIALTAKTLGDRPSPRRAVIVITDGVDTSSTLTAAEVSGLASAIDVPVYVIAVLSPLDHPGTDYAVPSATGSPVATQLANLAFWTGGDLIMASSPAHASEAARDILTQLRHQYLLAFESTRARGWYDLEVQVRRKGASVRARSGYFGGGAKPAFPSRASRRDVRPRSGAS